MPLQSIRPPKPHPCQGRRVRVLYSLKTGFFQDAEKVPHPPPTHTLSLLNTTLRFLLNSSHLDNIFTPILKISETEAKEVNYWTIFLQQISSGRKPESKSHADLSDSKSDLQCDHFHSVLINDSRSSGTYWLKPMRLIAGLSGRDGLTPKSLSPGASLYPQAERKSYPKVCS